MAEATCFLFWFFFNKISGFLSPKIQAKGRSPCLW
jgi:hypothetical protein